MPSLVQLAEEAQRAFESNVPPSNWGPKAWALLHGTVAALPCPTCRDEGVILVEGLHDIVNVAKGERPEKPRSLCTLAQQATDASSRVGACRVSAPGR